MKPKAKQARLDKRVAAWEATLKSRGTMSKMRVDGDSFHKPGSLKK